MDEPTDGLDPNQKYEVRAMIREMAKEKTIILSSHILEEVEAVCTRAIIIANGKIVADDTPEGLKSRSSVHGTVCFTIQGVPEKEILQGLNTIPGVRDVETDAEDGEGGVVVRIYPADSSTQPVDEVMNYFIEKGIAVRSLFVEKGRLDEVFRSITTTDSGETGT